MMQAPAEDHITLSHQPSRLEEFCLSLPVPTLSHISPDRQALSPVLEMLLVKAVFSLAAVSLLTLLCLVIAHLGGPLFGGNRSAEMCCSNPESMLLQPI